MEINKNLCLRSDEPGEVLDLLGDLSDGVADETSTQEYIETLVIAIESSMAFLTSIGQEDRVKNLF